MTEPGESALDQPAFGQDFATMRLKKSARQQLLAVEKPIRRKIARSVTTSN